jgi:single-stranded DNA-specific DHH superfamily exonuclease
MIDDSELCRRTEEHIKEINEKNRKMAEEIYNEVMEYRESKRSALQNND